MIQKTIPLETPTRIELSPNNEIQVTLFDANHCTGAVMFRKFQLGRFYLRMLMLLQFSRAMAMQSYTPEISDLNHGLLTT